MSKIILLNETLGYEFRNGKRTDTQTHMKEKVAAFMGQRVRDAWNYRKETIDISSCRVSFGEADITIRGVYERSDAKVRLQEGMERSVLYFSGGEQIIKHLRKKQYICRINGK